MGAIKQKTNWSASIIIMRIFRIIWKCLLIYAAFILITNFLLPLFHRDVSTDHQQEHTKQQFESEQESSERILCIDENEQALIWRLRMIASAQEKIVLTTFDLRTDNSGTDVIAALYEAAQRNVKIQILIDGIYEPFFLRDNPVFNALAAHENVDVKFYNPIRWDNLYRVNYRMHDKYLIIDDSMYLLGGRNSNDIFLGDYSETINIDREILVYETDAGNGESFQSLLSYFEAVWNEDCTQYKTVDPDAAEQQKYAQIFQERYENLKQTYGDFTKYNSWMDDTFAVNKITLITNETHAGNKEPRVFGEILELAKNGETVLIQTPYVICNNTMYDGLSEISQSADLEIMINAVEKGSNPWGCTDYLNNKEKISKTGATVYEVMNDQAVHTKTVLIDQNLSIIGSYNLDMRSTYLDTEIMLVIDSTQLNAHLREMGNEYARKSKVVHPDGQEIENENYIPAEMDSSKELYYGLLRVIIRPFRYLL